MLTSAIFKKASDIIEEAKTNKNFHADYENNLRATGASAEEYALYEIELNEEYYLVIDFVNHKFEDVSLVNRGHEAHISYNVGEEYE
jgi:plasmid maintenance system killer protein